ncbi:MAG: hypothetical protein AUJ75_01465 [Candidatus Omnitrophica bacterium CG1_02_49_10]|nr:MAG: hypothetical protein AUJ75_01465 [Candidatus Omnitrophica bacterium CG1_02_49_10]
MSLNRAISKFGNAKILVIGDIILDQFIWGSVDRISPEAPVPVVKVTSESFMPGGATNVANNIHALGGKAYICGIVGNDNWGNILKEELAKRSIDIEGLVLDGGRPTTLKTRVIAHHQQVVRIDREKEAHIDDNFLESIITFVREKISEVDAILIEDYGKGVVTPALLQAIIPLAKEHGKIVTIDPKEEHLSYYKGVTVITPNHHEAANAVGLGRFNLERDLEKVGHELLNRLESEAVLVTLGEHGMCLFEKSKKPFRIPTVAREVFDVSGAGDTVISALTLALVSGANMRDAAVISNCAAGIVVGKVGVAVVTQDELRKGIERWKP